MMQDQILEHVKDASESWNTFMKLLPEGFFDEEDEADIQIMKNMYVSGFSNGCVVGKKQTINKTNKILGIYRADFYLGLVITNTVLLLIILEAVI